MKKYSFEQKFKNPTILGTYMKMQKFIKTCLNENHIKTIKINFNLFLNSIFQYSNNSNSNLQNSNN